MTALRSPWVEHDDDEKKLIPNTLAPDWADKAERYTDDVRIPEKIQSD